MVQEVPNTAPAIISLGKCTPNKTREKPINDASE